jgi:Spy/CpxP family protein refolding chaperone
MMPARSPAEMLLRQKERLELTDDQAKRLDALSKSQRDALKPQLSSMLRARADLADAEEKENLDGQRSALEKLAKIRVDQDIARRKAMKDARDVLTLEQRDRLPALMNRGAGRGGMRPGAAMGLRGRGGMPGGRGGMRRMGPPNGMPGAAGSANMRPGMMRMRPPVRDTIPSIPPVR